MLQLRILHQVFKFLVFKIFFLLILSCDSAENSSNTTISVSKYSEYDCQDDKFRVIKETPKIPYLKVSIWYTRKQFHEAYYDYNIESYKKKLSKEDFLKITPKVLKKSNLILNELIKGVDCEKLKYLSKMLNH